MKKIKEETLNDIRTAKPYLITLAVMITTGLILQIIFYDLLGVRKELIPCFFFFSIIPFLIIFNIFIKQKKVDFKEIGISKNKLLKNVMLGLLVGVFAGIVGLTLFSVLGVPAEKIAGEDARRIFVLLFLPMCICAPIWEEVATRGLFYTFVEKSTRSRFKDKRFVKDSIIILVVSLFFLFAHYGREPRLLFVIFVTSVIYTAAYYKTKNIIVAILAHSLYNLFVILRVLV